MSREHARSFLEQMEKDPALRQSAAKAGAGHFAERLIALGAERGLSFSESELLELCNEAPAGKSGELDDTDLKQVAGGVSKAPSLFDAIARIIERYDASAKNVIQSLRG